VAEEEAMRNGVAVLLFPLTLAAFGPDAPRVYHFNTVQGAPAWWGMSHMGRRTPKVAEFWKSIEPLIEKRHRCFLSDVADVESLCNV